MSIKRIFIVISAIFAVSAVFADNSSVTSKKYVDDLMSGYQGKLPGSGANTLMIYDDDAGIGEKSIAATLGNSASAVSVPTVGAVKTGLDGKQDTITGTAGYVMTGTGTAGKVGAKPIYSANTNYSDSLVTAETVNTGVINAVNSSLIRVNEQGAPSDSGTLWEINTDLLALDVRGYLPDGYTQLEWIESSGSQYIDTGITSYKNTNKLKLKIRPSQVSNTMFVTYQNPNDGASNVGLFVSSSSLNYQYGPLERIRPLIAANTDYVIETGNGFLTVNGDSYTGTMSSEFTIYEPLYVGAGTGSSVVDSRSFVGRIYYYRYEDKDGNLLFNGIPAKDSNDVIGMYDTVSGEFFTNQGIGDFTAGPSCISPNLFDGQIELGSIDTTDGSLVVNNSRTRSVNYIPVEPNTTYTFTRENLNGVRWIVCYDANKNGITDGLMSYPAAIAYIQSGGTATTFTTTPTTRYIKWYDTSNAGLNEKVQIEQGSTATTYRPYGENICD